MQEPDLVLLPPARQGDLYQVSQQRPDAIGLVDGLFEEALSVWHKEVLWALEQGIPVWGAASMGALRAAELHEFGMRGVGAVFEAYRNGTLLDDGDVAVLHGPVEAGCVAVTEAMVNVMATLDRAVEHGVMDGSEAKTVISEARNIFFKDRTWDAVLERLNDAVRSRLQRWLPVGYVNQKRLDAIAMIIAMRNHPKHGQAEARPDWRLAHTAAWDAVLRRDTTSSGAAGLLCEGLPIRFK